MRTCIGDTRFWIDREPRSIGIRSANKQGQPFELYLTRYFRWLPDFEFYESEDDGAGRELRISARWLWFTLNMLAALLAPRPLRDKEDEWSDRWGFNFFSDGELCLAWGCHHLRWELPFVALLMVRREVLSIDGKRTVWKSPESYKGISRELRREIRAKEDASQAENSATFPYRYELHSGEVQEVQATIYTSRYVHRYKWTPFLRIRDSISVHFSEEVGPARGSWKGGCLGCGYTLKKGEDSISCLRRMERERRFER